MKKRISILGCGWVGNPLATYLTERGYDVKGSATSKNSFSASKTNQNPIKQYEIRLPQDLHLDSVKDFFDCDLLIITVPPALKLTREKRSLSCYIEELVTRIAEAGVKSLLYLGSTAVYGEVSGLVTEETTPNPTTERAENLLQIEKIVRSSNSLSSTILRCAGLAGYNRDPGTFLAGRSNLPSPALPVNILHRDDCVMIIEKVISLSKTGEIYNLCTDQHPLRKDFYIQRALKLGLTAPTFLKEGGANNKIISNEKVKQDLDYTFKYPDPMTMP